MFSKILSGLTLTTQVADGLFQNINGQGYAFDKSFLATLRALMYSRIPKAESIYLEITTSNYSDDTIRNNLASECVKAMIKRNSHTYNGAPGTLHIHSFEGNSDGNNACFGAVDNGGLSKCVGSSYIKLSDVEKFIEQNIKTKSRVFISEERKSVLIFIENLNINKWHFLQCLIPRYFPWYFDDKPLSEQEKKLIHSLTTRYAPEYIELIEQFAKQFDFRSTMIRNSLKGFENAFEKNTLDRVRYSINSTRESIVDLEEEFKRLYQELERLNIQELGLVAKLRDSVDDDQDTELVNYFLCNKSLDISYVNGGVIQFVVKTTAANYDPEVAEAAIEKVGRSFFYRHYEHGTKYQNAEMTDERIHRLMRAIFIDEIMKLRLCAAYRLNFENGDYRGEKNFDFGDEVLSEYTPNQHIQHYACLGNNHPTIRKAMMDRDYVTAVSACCASATNINFSEANTGTFLMQKVFANDVGKCIQMPDGSTATPLDAVKWLEQQDNKAKEGEVNE